MHAESFVSWSRDDMSRAGMMQRYWGHDDRAPCFYLYDCNRTVARLSGVLQAAVESGATVAAPCGKRH